MPRWNVRMLVGMVAGGLVLVGLVACDESPSEPQASVQLQLDTVVLHLMPGQRVAAASAHVAGTASISPKVELPVELATPEGDSEEVMLGPPTCHAPNGVEYACHCFTFEMSSGHTAEEIAPELDASGMRLIYVYSTLPGGAVVVVRGSDEAALDALRDMPNVVSAEYVTFVTLFGDDTDDTTDASVITGVVAVDWMSVRNPTGVTPGNGVLELHPDQPVTARYRQPDGSLLTTTQVMR